MIFNKEPRLKGRIISNKSEGGRVTASFAFIDVHLNLFHLLHVAKALVVTVQGQ